jgi:hypothetical protein
MDTHATIVVLLEMMFSTWSVQMAYKEYTCYIRTYPRVEAGSNTSTVTLRVVGGDENGSLESEAVKYGHEFYRTRTQK